MNNTQIPLGTRLARFRFVHPFGRIRLSASLAPAIRRRADFTHGDGNVVKCHLQSRSRKPSPIQGCKLDRSHDRGVRPIPKETEEGDRHFASTDSDNDLTRVTADHDDCAIKLCILTDGSAEQFSEFRQQTVRVVKIID